MWFCDHENMIAVFNGNVWWRNVAEDSMCDMVFKGNEKPRHEDKSVTDLGSVNVQER